MKVNLRSRRVNTDEVNPRSRRGMSGVLDSQMLVEVKLSKERMSSVEAK